MPFGHHLDRHWPPHPGAQSRAGRAGGRYRTFLPDPIEHASFLLDDGATFALHGATKAFEHLQHTPSRTATLGAVAQNLLRSESVASSRIEGVLVSHKRLARVEHLGVRKGRRDDRAAEVLGNVEAMRHAIEVGAAARPLAVEDLVEIHRLLLRFVDDHGIAGVVRTSQNWIGGNDYNPVGATFVPPPPEYVPELLRDLCAFVERDDLPPLLQAAVAHAQFETIHPFADGNGRTGRALIYAILRRRGEVTRYLPPISLMLVSAPRSYIGGLTDYREGRVSEWCESFAVAAARAATEAGRLAAAIEDLEEKWLERAGRPREGSAARLLISALPEQPVFDAAIAQRLTGRSHVAVNGALRRLESAGLVRRLNEKKWGRAWECSELIELVERFEESASTSDQVEAGKSH
jgi:Fic family protein